MPGATVLLYFAVAIARGVSFEREMKKSRPSVKLWSVESRQPE